MKREAGGSRMLRPGLFALGFAIALLTTAYALDTYLNRAGIESEALTRHAVAEYYTDRVQAYIDHTPAGRDYDVVFLGDSMVVSYPQSHQIPAMLQRQVRRLSRGEQRAWVHNLGLAGTGVYDYYFMADVIDRLEPDLVVIAFNLASTSRNFQAAFSRPELAGWLAPSRILETLFLPMNWIGLTADRLLLYSAIVKSGGFDHWVALNEQQMRLADARVGWVDALATEDAGGLGAVARFRKKRGNLLLERNNQEGGARHTALATRDHLGAAVAGLDPDHPVIEMLGATVRTYRERGAEVLVYLTPLNVEHAQRVGVMDREGLSESVRVVTEAVTVNDGHVVDLHAVFPDEGFRDRSGHLAYEGGFNGPRELAAKLAPALVQLIRERLATPPQATTKAGD